MNEVQRFETVKLPPTISDANAVTELRCAPSMVIVGANGSGKTRIGTWLEVKGPAKERAYRIPAQRSLSFPRSASPIGMQMASDNFQYGDRPRNWGEEVWEANKHERRLNNRYGNVDFNSIATAPVTDFEKLMVLLFSENYSALIKFDAENESTKNKVESPQSTLKKVKRVWECVLSHRRIEYQSGEVRIKPLEQGANSYLATGLSDGERVVFYLIAQCLCAPKDSMIIIDEPELHLHRSIQRRLWDAIEAERPDCQFIYITHDLVFAEERTEASKVWLKSSTNDTYDWLQLDPIDGIPEDLFLEVLGSRRPIIFTEGNFDSIDFDVYNAVYPKFLIRPIGSCSAVVQATKAFREIVNVHNLQSFGMVDRDYLTEGQLAAYKRSGVGSPAVAEIENMFLVPEILMAMTERLEVGASEVEKVYDHVYSEFRRKLEAHALSLTKRDVVLALGRFGTTKSSVSELEGDFNDFTSSINIAELYDRYIAEGQALLENRDYIGILKVFNNKELIGRVSSFFGITKPTYLERARKMARKGDEKIVAALALYLPDLAELQ